MSAFLRDHVVDYEAGHDDLPGERTSNLSAHLRWGCLSPLELAVEDTYVDDLVLRWTVELVRATREVDGVAIGASVRGSLTLERSARAWALLQGRGYVEPEDVERLFEAAVDAYSEVNVLVNNAGYGHEGILEESSIDDLRRQFEVNVFGAVAMIQAVLPSMRRRRAGHILNITSMGGIITLPGLSYYHGSKFALEGISESLGKEVKDLGIKVTAVEPGGFRTDWAGRSMVRAERSIGDYDSIIEPIRERSCWLRFRFL